MFFSTLINYGGTLAYYSSYLLRLCLLLSISVILSFHMGCLVLIFYDIINKVNHLTGLMQNTYEILWNYTIYIITCSNCIVEEPWYKKLLKSIIAVANRFIAKLLVNTQRTNMNSSDIQCYYYTFTVTK